jgi:bifunctional non-homologous end joining protein LigD
MPLDIIGEGPVSTSDRTYQSGRSKHWIKFKNRKHLFINPFERGEIGPDLFAAACRMGLEGLVSKRRDRPYQSGRSKHWIKIKNRKHPAMSRVMEAFS